MPIDLPSGVLVEVESPTPPNVYTAPPSSPTTLIVPTPGSPGPPGSPGVGTTDVERTAAVILSGHRVVTVDDMGEVIYADPTDSDHISRPMWLTTSAVAEGATATLKANGFVEEGSWSWSPGAPIYLGLNGVLTQTPPVGAVFLRVVAEVVAPTVIDFDPQPAVVLA